MISYENLRICTFNAHSLRDRENRTRFWRWMRSQPFDIIFLQEPSTQHAFTIPERNSWRREWGGTAIFSQHCAILFNNSHLQHTPQKEYLEGRILTIDIYLENEPNQFVRLVNVYAPANSDTGMWPVYPSGGVFQQTELDHTSNDRRWRFQLCL